MWLASEKTLPSSHSPGTTTKSANTQEETKIVPTTVLYLELGPPTKSGLRQKMHLVNCR